MPPLSSSSTCPSAIHPCAESAPAPSPPPASSRTPPTPAGARSKGATRSARRGPRYDRSPVAPRLDVVRGRPRRGTENPQSYCQPEVLQHSPPKCRCDVYYAPAPPHFNNISRPDGLGLEETRALLFGRYMQKRPKFTLRKLSGTLTQGNRGRINAGPDSSPGVRRCGAGKRRDAPGLVLLHDLFNRARVASSYGHWDRSAFGTFLAALWAHLRASSR